jgi:geranylgeranyl pyrophosphate synthase
MSEECSVEKRCRKILEDNGGFIADKARTILFEDPSLKELRAPLEFISNNWRNPLTPAMMSLSCQAVGGRSEETCDTALAVSLMSLSFYVWDDIIDKATFKSFKSTLIGKFGESVSLIVGGLAAAKAFTILSKMSTGKTKKQRVTEMCWGLWSKMAQAETVALRVRRLKTLSSRNKFWKIKTEAADLETCLKIGAVLGNAAETEIQHLGNYGLCLGIILELWKDFHVSVNLTLGLADRIKSQALPYSVLWASERSSIVQKKLETLTNRNVIEPADIREIVEGVLRTEALHNITKPISKLAKKAEKELADLKKTPATRTLQFFVRAQPKLFTESIPMLQKR